VLVAYKTSLSPGFETSTTSSEMRGVTSIRGSITARAFHLNVVVVRGATRASFASLALRETLYGA
jgi:hypothetical protein